MVLLTTTKKKYEGPEGDWIKLMIHLKKSLPMVNSELRKDSHVNGSPFTYLETPDRLQVSTQAPPSSAHEPQD